ncbi:MAG TPA: UDP-4-amino-4,6-dideoxy-N-acetyl-beta-L-altrosamine transaminase [Cellvibrionaceae bacterium]|nr:UDP-4-amino-4,6-dideoxy-N-acetyl-beta-L-altrosamine transaminase [Cellvibrionaceae bacterium]
MIPYGRQHISEQEIDATRLVLQSDWLTQGPKVAEFEAALAAYVQAPHAITCANGTAALHAACAALGLGPGDELWTSPNSFVASANCGMYLGAKVDFVDIDPHTRNLCPKQLAAKLAAGRVPKILVAVHFAGVACDMPAIFALAQKYGFYVVEDAAHAIGTQVEGVPVGACRFSHATCFSFHPVKNLTTGEGGAITTADAVIANRLRRFVTHGITKNPEEFTEPCPPPWYYEQQSLGFNYRLCDIQAAVGIVQLSKLESFIQKRMELFQRYQDHLVDLPVTRPTQPKQQRVAPHIYVVELPPDSRLPVFNSLKAAGVGVNVHYIPIHLQPYYRALGFKAGDFPVAEQYYAGALTLPLFVDMSVAQQDYVIEQLERALCA